MYYIFCQLFFSASIANAVIDRYCNNTYKKGVETTDGRIIYEPVNKWIYLHKGKNNYL